MPVFGPCECCGRERFLAYRMAPGGIETMACAECCGCAPTEFDPPDDDQDESFPI